MIFVTFGVAAGVSCALLRYPFFPLVPTGTLFATGAVLTGVVPRTHPGVIVLEAFGSLVASQFAFVAMGLTRVFVRSTRLIAHVQAAIGK